MDAAWTWNCDCGVRGTIVISRRDDAAATIAGLGCMVCGELLPEPRPSRRAPPSESRAQAGVTSGIGDALSDADLARCAREWNHTQELLGRLGVMAESNWALDWADRLIADLRRRRE